MKTYDINLDLNRFGSVIEETMANVESMAGTVAEQFGTFLIAGGGTSTARLNLKRYKARKQYSDSTLFKQGQLLPVSREQAWGVYRLALSEVHQ